MAYSHVKHTQTPDDLVTTFVSVLAFWPWESDFLDLVPDDIAREGCTQLGFDGNHHRKKSKFNQQYWGSRNLHPDHVLALICTAMLWASCAQHTPFREFLPVFGLSHMETRL
jgi:hypothetical protein